MGGRFNLADLSFVERSVIVLKCSTSNTNVHNESLKLNPLNIHNVHDIQHQMAATLMAFFKLKLLIFFIIFCSIRGTKIIGTMPRHLLC